MDIAEAELQLKRFCRKIDENATLRLSVDGEEYRLTKVKGLPLGVKPTHFALVTWPKGTATGYFGVFNARSGPERIVYDMMTNDIETGLLIAATSMRDLESVIGRLEVASDALAGWNDGQPIPVSGWVMTPNRGIYQLPFYRLGDVG
jgi:hypothetical protein